MSKNSKDDDHPTADSPAGGGFESVRVKLEDALEKIGKTPTRPESAFCTAATEPIRAVDAWRSKPIMGQERRPLDSI